MKQELITETFTVINDICDQFVTLRNFDHIPGNCTIDNDIDVLIPGTYMADITAALQSLGYSVRTDNLSYLYGAEPHIHFLNSEKDVHFDTVTGLYYRSLSDDNIFVNVDKRLLESMLSNRVECKECWMYKPAPEDYLTHICCHVIFDKKLCTDKYADIIHAEFRNCDKEKLSNLFNYAFYTMGDTLLKCIESNEAKYLFDNYMTSTKY